MVTIAYATCFGHHHVYCVLNPLAVSSTVQYDWPNWNQKHVSCIKSDGHMFGRCGSGVTLTPHCGVYIQHRVLVHHAWRCEARFKPGHVSSTRLHAVCLIDISRLFGNSSMCLVTVASCTAAPCTMMTHQQIAII